MQLFITGTDTEVGKSVFTASFANYLSSKGYKVAISKPFQSGEPKDTDTLKELTNNKIPIFNTYTFKLPAAPSVAARDENTEVDIKKVLKEVKELEKEFDFLLVEGVGGIAVPLLDKRPETVDNRLQSTVYSPLSTDHCPYILSDLIKTLEYPCLVVSRPNLGTINHTALTIGHAKSRGINVIGFVVSGYDENTKDKVVISNPNEIEKYSLTKCLGKLPLLKNVDYKSVTSIDSSVFSEILSSTSSISSSSNPSSPANV